MEILNKPFSVWDFCLSNASEDVVLRYRCPGGAELVEPKVCKDAGEEVLVDMIESASQTISCSNFSIESLWEGIRSGEDCRMRWISELTVTNTAMFLQVGGGKTGPILERLAAV